MSDVDPPQGPDPIVVDTVLSDDDTFLEYVASMTSDFSRMVAGERFPALAYLLAMTQLEAERVLHRRPAGQGRYQN